jgi:adenylate cyclase
MSQTRRLAATLAADVAGYSRLMGADEEGTLERLKAQRRELLYPKIAEHRGGIVKTTGAVCWWNSPASSTGALRRESECEITERNADVPPDRRIEIRMGINASSGRLVCWSRRSSAIPATAPLW